MIKEKDNELKQLQEENESYIADLAMTNDELESCKETLRNVQNQMKEYAISFEKREKEFHVSLSNKENEG